MTHPSRSELYDYFDGLAEEAAADRIRSHISECETCAHVIQRAEDVRSALRSNAPQKNAPPSTWAGVEATITERKQPWWHSQRNLAAAAVFLIVMSSALTLYFTLDSTAPQRAYAPSSTQVHNVARNDIEANYVRTTHELLVQLEQRTSTMDTATARIVRDNLLVIDSAIANARSTMSAHPQNEDVAQMLHATYEAKIRMLKRALRVRGT